MTQIRSPLQALVVQWSVQPGQAVAAGAVILVLEAMKMEHEVHAPVSGVLTETFFAVGELVGEGDVLATLGAAVVQAAVADAATSIDSDTPPASTVRADVQRMLDRLDLTQDHRRPADMAKRHAACERTWRTCATREAGVNTAQWPWPRRVAAAVWPS